ncbi:MAG: single-stranded nucleic acid binding domain protein [Solirubrobacterales bacterium]|jgi:spoIIIJ-associated protein|nr:single-stranded nucleic acid binding domain protein [Solirubrobacterales bacterium]
MTADESLPSSPVDRVRLTLEKIVAAIGVEAAVHVEEDADSIRANLEGEELGLAIGRHGQTIDAIQHLAYRVAFRDEDERKRVEVDAAGYRDRRAAVLEEEADRAADEAIRSGRPVELDAMNAVERRVVHEYLRERGDVETYSEGREPDRRLVVSPLAT